VLWRSLAAWVLAGGPLPRPFTPGEQATYAISYLGLTAGTAQVTVGASTERDGRPIWPIVTIGKTDPALVFFPVRDKYVTYWEPESRLTAGTDFTADENHHRRRERARFDREKGQATVSVRREGGEEQLREVEVPTGTLDIAAAVFALRGEPLEVGRELELPVFAGTKTFTLHARVEARERLKTAAGERDCFRLRVQLGFGGGFASKRDLIAYLAADATHVPVRIEADFALGTLAAELTDYKPGMHLEDAP
jgi:hypothetical protein